jgi:hypothetical protein
MLQPSSAALDDIHNSDEGPVRHNNIGGAGPFAVDKSQRLVDAYMRTSYLEFVARPKLRRMLCDLMRWDKEVLVKGSMPHHNISGGPSTGAHYAKLFLRGGVAVFLTAWVPIGDTTATGGRQIYLEDNAGSGKSIEDDFYPPVRRTVRSRKRSRHSIPSEPSSKPRWAVTCGQTCIGYDPLMRCWQRLTWHGAVGLCAS